MGNQSNQLNVRLIITRYEAALFLSSGWINSKNEACGFNEHIEFCQRTQII